MPPGPGRWAGLRRLAVEHRAFLIVVLAWATVWAFVVGRASPWATVSLDCAASTVGTTILSEPAWNPWNVVDGPIGAQLLAGVLWVPGWLALGATGGASKLGAFCLSVGLFVIVYALVLRAAERLAAVLAVAGVAFCVPAVFHPSLVFGNWHWSQLLFDYGSVLLALRIGWPPGGRRGPRDHALLLLLGILSGIGVHNSPQSIPFVAAAWGVVLIGRGPRGALTGLPAAAAGVAVGLAPLLWRVLVFRLPGEAANPDKKDVVWGRLFQYRVEWDKLADLVWPELPATLHVREALPWMSLQTSSGLETAWVSACWGGIAFATVALVDRFLRREADDAPALAARAAPLFFVAVFAAAYVVLDARIEILPPELSEHRQHSHRTLPPLFVAMTVCSGLGWACLWQRLGGLGSRPLRATLRTAALGVALVPAGVGLLTQISIAAQAPAFGVDSLTAYRGVCFDLPGFFAAGKVDELEPLQDFCGQLSTPERRGDCLEGAAMGVGFQAARLVGPRPFEGDGFDDPCSRIPPDLRPKCDAWNDGDAPMLAPELEPACSALEPERRDRCFMGAGWFVSQVPWGHDGWPVEACNSLAGPADRDACWAGAGFHAADHLGPTPDRLRYRLELIPEDQHRPVGWGAGYLFGRTWTSERIALGFCEELGGELAVGCAAGVPEGRRWAFPD